MKKLFSILLIALLLPLSVHAADQWQEGKHYKVISDKATAKPEVKEFFSFWCPACYRFEPLVKGIKAGIGEDVKFTKVHVNFMQFTGPDVQEDATKAMIIARAMKKETELNGAIFNYIHQQKSTVSNLKDLRSVFIINGIEPEEFDKMAKSFSVKSLVNKNNKEITKFRKHLNGVPNFIVNGKYQAQFTREMTTDDIVNLIIWLTKQP
ncbi:thiol:disulfide interchange protein DsbA/DsbL [Glaciecola sp. MF2-115]|uniref:thiol:disulfide interchange protein DsbA/DsbL n=1 Tax=Glaciecola sp. MF2-115 TaxID=3384827 RepID=UPI0039A05CB5